MRSDDGERVEDIAKAFTTSAPEGWVQIEVEAPSISEVTGYTAVATLPDAERCSFYIEDRRLALEAIRTIQQLRRSMAAQNADGGAWFTMKLDISSDGKFAAEFDYDSAPEFDFEISRESLLADLAEFPRSADHVPDWLRSAADPPC